MKKNYTGVRLCGKPLYPTVTYLIALPTGKECEEVQKDIRKCNRGDDVLAQHYFLRVAYESSPSHYSCLDDSYPSCSPEDNRFGMYVVELGLEACSSETPEPSRNGRNALTDCVYEQIQCYLQGGRREFDFPICMKGTDFQKRVWKALCEIPYGETRSYKEIAETVGNPKACRAVGGANNKNPIAVAVPCHRVIGSDGSLVGYGLGTGLKKILLDLERKTERIATEKKENGVVKS